MKKKIQKIQTRIDNDPRLKEAVSKIKPKKSIWGIGGIILFFFIPELLTYIWQDELINWAHTHSITEPIAMQRWLYAEMETMFSSGVSWLNITLGSALLVWVLRK